MAFLSDTPNRLKTCRLLSPKQEEKRSPPSLSFLLSPLFPLTPLLGCQEIGFGRNIFPARFARAGSENVFFPFFLPPKMIQDYFFSGVKTILMKEEPFSANLQECKEMFQNITLHNSFTLLGILFRCRIFLKFFSAALLEIVNKLWNPLNRVSSIIPTRYSLAHVKKEVEWVLLVAWSHADRNHSLKTIPVRGEDFLTFNFWRVVPWLNYSRFY